MLGAQSSAFSVSNLSLPSPDSQVTMEQLQSVLTWLQQASTNFIQRPNAGQCITQHESVSQTTHTISRRLRLTQLLIWLTPLFNRVPHLSRHIILHLIVPLRPTLRRLMFHYLLQVYILSIPPLHRVFNSDRVYPPLLLVVVFTTCD